MVEGIVWTDTAIIELQDIIHYWNERNQSKRYSNKIRTSLNNGLNLLKTTPEIGRKTNIPTVRIKVLLQHFLLIYKKTSDNKLLILNFWDSRRNPALNKYLR